MVVDTYTIIIPGKGDNETMLDKLRLIMATFVYQHYIQELLQPGVDFTKHLYVHVPEIDPHTGEEWHDQGDHNHICINNFYRSYCSFSCKYRCYKLHRVGVQCYSIMKGHNKGTLPFYNQSFDIRGFFSFHSIVLLVFIIQLKAI